MRMIPATTFTIEGRGRFEESHAKVQFKKLVIRFNERVERSFSHTKCHGTVLEYRNISLGNETCCGS